MNPINPYPTRKTHPSAMRYTTRTTPTPTPSETLTNLLHLTRSKLSLLYASSDASSSSAGPESDQLRRSVLLSNAYDSGWKLRVETIEREREEREVRELKSVLGRPSASGQGKRRRERGWEGPVYEVGMDALFEDDEEDESEAQNDDMQVKVVDPSQYTGMGVGVEQAGEEAWFEQTWNELHGDDSAVGTVEVYPVEEDDSMYSLSSSGSTSPSSSRSTSPSSGDDRDHHLELDFHLLVAPPTPKLGPTKVDDKLEGPVEWGTMAAGLECGVQVEWIMERWEVLEDDDDEVEGVVGYATAADIVDVAYTAHTATEEEDDSSDSFSDVDVDVDMDVPDLVDSDVDEFDEQPHQRLTSSFSKSNHYGHLDSSSSSSFDEPLLVTPTEDALDDFDQVDDESDGRDYDDDDERERKGGLVEVGFKGNKEGGGGGLFVAPRATSGGLIRVVR